MDRLFRPDRTGRRRDTLVSTHLCHWQLGNTPFERELAWQRLLDEPLTPEEVQQHTDSATKGWALGSGAFLAKLGASCERPMAPRPRGRPARSTKVDPVCP